MSSRHNHRRKIVICGAGIAGISVGFYLSRSVSEADIILIDKNQPVSLTSSKSGENFRDYWPHQSMASLSHRSIELMKDLKDEFVEDAFAMEFSGYHFISHQTEPIFTNENSAAFQKHNRVDQDELNIHKFHPYLDPTIAKSVFIKNAGHIDSITMANIMLADAKKRGLRYEQKEIKNLNKTSQGYTVHCDDNSCIDADQLIICAGPFINHLANMLDLSFPVWNTLQRKFIIPDPLRIIPRDMPFTIYVDGQTLSWSAEERDVLKASKELMWMTEPFPGAIHIKPDSGDRIKLGWAFSRENVTPSWTIETADYFPQIVLKGASRFIPELKHYSENMPTPLIEYGGHYTRTKENWPLIGPTRLEDVYVIGALAGFGTMTACAAGELCTAYLTNKTLPDYAPFFHPERYADPKMKLILDSLTVDGQL